MSFSLSLSSPFFSSVGDVEDSEGILERTVVNITYATLINVVKLNPDSAMVVHVITGLGVCAVGRDVGMRRFALSIQHDQKWNLGLLIFSPTPVPGHLFVHNKSLAQRKDVAGLFKQAIDTGKHEEKKAVVNAINVCCKSFLAGWWGCFAWFGMG